MTETTSNGAINAGSGRELGLPPVAEAAVGIRSIEQVLESISPEVPNSFREQAKRVADYIALLDSDIDASDTRAQTFKDELGSAAFIVRVYSHHSRNKLVRANYPDPQLALPKWLQRDFKITSQSQQRTQELADIKKEFQNWVGDKKLASHFEPQLGTYYVLDDVDQSTPEPRRFKCYIKQDLLTLLREKRLDPLFEELDKQGLNPKELKLDDGGVLMLYYDQDVELSDAIRAVFDNHKIGLRGPAQDVAEINVGEDETLHLDLPYSNDSALGGGNQIEYKVREYTPADFLDNYIQFCLWSGKDPSQPYKTSFVYLIDRQEQIPVNERDAAIQQATKMAGYPIVYAKSRLDVARK